ncbi:MAG: hypothetical protein M0018_10000 [Nitrospiraceae bacterium]|nr:hypothetical protein [Nitrospiraceae bacterium]
MNTTSRMDLKEVAFIGRTYSEYMDIFGLNEQALLNGPVLDCPAGASSFTAEAKKKGFDVTACDILYDLPAAKLEAMGRQALAIIEQKMEETAHLFNWGYYGDRKRHMGHRAGAFELFMADYPAGRTSGRYICAALPRLPFKDRSFELVLSSHFLFLYGDRFSPMFHAGSLKEMARVCRNEVRVYPLLGLNAKPYPHMQQVLDMARRDGMRAEIRATRFEFFKGADKLLILNPAKYNAGEKE